MEAFTDTLPIVRNGLKQAIIGVTLQVQHAIQFICRSIKNSDK